MRHEVFSVYDGVAQAFITPFFLPNVGLAKRIFGECANSDTHQFGKHPADFCLFHIGEFDDQLGLVLPFDKMVNLGLASIFVLPSDEVTS